MYLSTVPLVQGGTPLPGIEPGTRRLTAVCSTAELKRNVGGEVSSYSQLDSHTDVINPAL